MAVVALISHQDSIPLVLPWAAAFAKARSSALIVLCWTRSHLAPDDESGQHSRELVQAATDFVRQAEIDLSEIVGISGPSESRTAATFARKRDAELLVAVAAEDPTVHTGTSHETNQLLRQSPCNTVILFGGPSRSTNPQRIFVGATDSPHDSVAIILADSMAPALAAPVTLARAELNATPDGLELGRRSLDQLMRDAGVQSGPQIDCRVFQMGDRAAVAAAMNEHDLILLGADSPLLAACIELTDKPTVAIISRAPPLSAWRSSSRSAHWNPRLNPEDYADLLQGLRRGCRLNADFLTMLSLASIVASMGLLQDSAAVVIGSMLLAPLMTPMIGCGMALARANQERGHSAFKTVLVGLLCTLAISFVIGLVTPGAELTPQIYARGAPTILDLVVALTSAAAAAYALARPNLVGSVAGVAIATALVPPLCSVGLSLAYSDFNTARGAALLFSTNFLAIVLSAALTFRLIGVTTEEAGVRQRRWVFRSVIILCVSTIVICIPLQIELLNSLVESKPQPRAFPLAKSVMDGLEERVESEPGVSIISVGRLASRGATADVLVVLGASEELDPAFAGELTGIVRERMHDESLVVRVHCIQQQWERPQH